MADESTQAQVLERTPPDASPPDPASPVGGLGANEQAQAQEPEAKPSKADAAYAKLQSEYDKTRARLERVESEAAEAHSRLSDTLSYAELQELQSRAPDASLNPEEAARYWQTQALKYGDQLRQSAKQRSLEIQSDRAIAKELRTFHEKTGVFVDRWDERLDLKQGGPEGWRAFKRSLERIENEVTGKTRREAEDEERIKKAAEKLAEEKLKEYGVDRFDSGAGRGPAGALTLERYQSMPYEERQKLKRESPHLIDEMMRRGR